MLQRAAQVADKEAADRLIEFEDAVYAELEQKGIKIVTLTRRELQLWRICSSDVLTDFVAKAGEAGERLVDAYGSLRQDPCCNPLETRDSDN